jgi:hypothetical protein
MNVTEDENTITDEEPEMIILRIAAAIIGGILSAIKNLVEWVYCAIEWDSIKKAIVFILAVSIPACLAAMFVYHQKREYPHCQSMCIKYAANNAKECFQKCKGE